MSGTIFILYDGRAKCGSEDEASVLTIVQTEDQARRDGATNRWSEYDAIWYECPLLDEKNVGPGVPRWDLPPASTNASRRKRKRSGGAP